MESDAVRTSGTGAGLCYTGFFLLYEVSTVIALPFKTITIVVAI